MKRTELFSRRSLSAQEIRMGPEQELRVLFRDSKMNADDIMFEEEKRRKRREKLRPPDIITVGYRFGAYRSTQVAHSPVGQVPQVPPRPYEVHAPARLRVPNNHSALAPISLHQSSTAPVHQQKQRCCTSTRHIASTNTTPAEVDRRSCMSTSEICDICCHGGVCTDRSRGMRRTSKLVPKSRP